MKRRTYKKTIKRFENRYGVDTAKITDLDWLARDYRRGRAKALTTRLHREFYSIAEYYYSRYYG